MPKEKD